MMNDANNVSVRFNLWPDLLSLDCVAFLHELHVVFESERQNILSDRRNNARDPDRFLARKLAAITTNQNETRSESSNPWKVAAIPDALKTRTVEITGPAEPKMIINALNSTADVFMADFEDSLSPTWSNVVEGHCALQAALRRTLTFESGAGANFKSYKIETSRSKIPTLIVRPRGWHLSESDFQVQGRPMSASLFDFGVYLYHAGKYSFDSGLGPYFYLPKLESSLEARLWSRVFEWSEKRLGLKPQSIRVTVLIETLPAAFEMEEILFELKNYVVGLNAGRWDYLFSVIKTLAGSSSEIIFPDRGKLTMNVPFLTRYCEKIVAVCERRGAMPMGGMSALIPSRKDLAQNERALKQVFADKQREKRMGFAGTWVAHPDLIAIAREAFELTARDAVTPTASIPANDDLIPKITEEPFSSERPTKSGALLNVDVALRYIAEWLGGTGAVAIHGLMEDAATAEISRAQLWQWRKRNVVLDDGETVSKDWIIEQIDFARKKISTEILKTEALSIAESRLLNASELLRDLVLNDQAIFPSFLTLPAMDRLKINTAGETHDERHDPKNQHSEI